MKIKDGYLGHLACFLVYTIFGLNIVVCKDLTKECVISPMAIFCLRSIGAGVLFWIISLIMPSEHVEKKDLPKIFAASILGFFLTQLSFLMAISRITPFDCSIISSLLPIFTMFIAAIVLKEPITLQKAGGVTLSFLGIILLIINGVNAQSTIATSQPSGIALMILNVLFFSLYLGAFKPLAAKYSPITFMKWIFLFSIILSLPIAGNELIHVEYHKLQSGFIWGMLYLIIFATFISYFLLPIGQKRIRPTLVSMYSYLQPIIATIISVFIGMDELSWQKLLAALMVFVGVIVVNKSKGLKLNDKSDHSDLN